MSSSAQMRPPPKNAVDASLTAADSKTESLSRRPTQQRIEKQNSLNQYSDQQQQQYFDGIYLRGKTSSLPQENLSQNQYQTSSHSTVMSGWQPSSLTRQYTFMPSVDTFDWDPFEKRSSIHHASSSSWQPPSSMRQIADSRRGSFEDSSAAGLINSLNPNAKEWSPHFTEPSNPDIELRHRSQPGFQILPLSFPVPPATAQNTGVSTVVDSGIEVERPGYSTYGASLLPRSMGIASGDGEDWIHNVDWSQHDNLMQQNNPRHIPSPFDVHPYSYHSRHKSLPPPPPVSVRLKPSLPRPISISDGLSALSLQHSPPISSPSSLPFPLPIIISGSSGSASTVTRRSITRKRNIPRPQNPGVGSRGISVKVLTNFYVIDWPKNLEAHHYEVKIQPETISRVYKRVIAAWKEQNSSTPEIWNTIFDGTRNLFSLTRLPFVNDELTVQVMLFDDENGRRRVQRFTLRMRKISEIRMDRLQQFTEGNAIEMPKDAIMILEVLLRQRPSSIFTTVGRGGGSFYSEHHNTPIANGLTVHQGWFQSVRPTFQKLLLNLDVSATSFYIAGSLIESVAKFFNKATIEAARQNFGDPHERKRLERFLRDVAIEINYRTTGRKRYKIKAITDKPVSQTLIVTGPERCKRIVPIINYFQDMYGVTLQYPWLPCVISGTNSDCILPMEVCFIRRNQRHVGKLNDQQLADIVKLTAVMPEYRKERVIEGMRQLHGGDTEHIDSWGVRVLPEMSIIDARILTPPPLTFGAGSDLGPTMTPVDGTWRIGRGLKFATPAILNTWAVAVFGDPVYFPLHTVGMFVKNVLTACVNLGMEISERNITDYVVYAPGRGGLETVEATLRMADERARTHFIRPGYGGMVGLPSAPPVAQLVICIMAQKNTVYEQIKRVAETEMGLMTQCVIGKHVHITKPSYAQNLALKINAKLGGVNSFVDPQKELGGLGATGIPTMLMGADVTHPQNGTSDPSSIAALVGTVDNRFCEYRASIRVQSTRREILSDLEGMARELLQLFRDRNGVLPQRVLFFRDGVGESQICEVSAEEISAVKRAFSAMGTPETKLTFLMVNKRHHGRFFPSRHEAGESDQKGNILAGTVIDSGVTHPFEFDFYLTSHPGMQGTSKASHYHVLHDDNSFSADDLQEITYRLCYNFARSTRAVSVVPPAYFAHLVAARARCYASSHTVSNSWTNWGNSNGNFHPTVPTQAVPPIASQSDWSAQSNSGFLGHYKQTGNNSQLPFHFASHQQFQQQHLAQHKSAQMLIPSNMGPQMSNPGMTGPPIRVGSCSSAGPRVKEHAKVVSSLQNSMYFT